MSGGSVLSRAVLGTAGMVVQGIARFVYTLAIGRIAGPESLGEISALLSLAVYASLFWPAAAGVAASRYLPVPRLSGPATGVLKRSFGWSVVVLGVASLVAAWMLGSDVAQIIGAAALVVSYSGYVFVRGVLMGEDRIARAAIVDTITSLLAITALVGVLLCNWNWALLLPLALSYAVFTLVSWPRGVAPAAQASVRREVLLFTRDSAIALLATGGLLPATMVFVRAFEPASVAGLFAAGLSLATPANLVAQAVNQVLVPHFARMQEGPSAALRASQLRVLLVTGAGFVVVFGLLIVLSPWILHVFYGESYVGGTLAMQMLLVVVGAMSVMSAPGAYLVAVGRQRLYAKIWLVATIAGTIVMAVGSPILGQWGAIAGFMLGGIGGSIAVIVCGLVLPPRTGGTAHSADDVVASA